MQHLGRLLLPPALLLGCLLALGCGKDPAPPVAVGGPPGRGPVPAASPAGKPAAPEPGRPAAPADPYQYGWIGGFFTDMSAERAASLGLPPAPGVLVVDVGKDSPAAKANLQPNDVIVGLDGHAVGDTNALIAAIRALPAGAVAELEIQRGQDLAKVQVTVGARSLKQAIVGALKKGAAWLVKEQRPGGWWPYAHVQYVGKGATVSIAYTSASFAALARLPAEVRAEPAVAAALSQAEAYVLAHQQPDGGLLDPQEQGAVLLRNFASALSILGLVAGDKAKHAEPVKKLAAFLASRQLSDAGGFAVHDWHHGGWNYYEDSRSFSLRSDMAVVSYVLEALVAAEFTRESPIWSRARRFVERAQNYREDAGERLAYDDGGFAFNARSSKAGEVEASQTSVRFRSYGSTSSDGLRSLLYVGLRAGDPRVEAAVDWLRAQYTVNANPGFSPKAEINYAAGIYFYYLRSLTEALATAGRTTLPSVDGQTRYWMRDVAERIRLVQGEDGRWQNPINIMNEDDPIIATSLALLTLSRIHSLLP